jgi:hypothetical protein
MKIKNYSNHQEAHFKGEIKYQQQIIIAFCYFVATITEGIQNIDHWKIESLALATQSKEIITNNSIIYRTCDVQSIIYIESDFSNVINRWVFDKMHPYEILKSLNWCIQIAKIVLSKSPYYQKVLIGPVILCDFWQKLFEVKVGFVWVVREDGVFKIIGYYLWVASFPVLH